MSHPVAKKLELALKGYLEAGFQAEGDELAGLQIYEGHRSGTLPEWDHLVITAINPGGDLAQSGIYETEVQLLLVTYAVEQEGEAEAPDTRHARRAEELVAIFAQEKMGDVVDALNLASAETGVGVSCYEVGQPQEAQQSPILATALPMTWTAHLV